MNAAGIFLAARLALVSIGQTARHFFSELASYCKIPLFLSNPLRQLLLCTKQEKKRGNACEDFLCLFYSLSSHSISKCSVGPTLRPLFLKGCFFTPPWEISFSQVLGEWGEGEDQVRAFAFAAIAICLTRHVRTGKGEGGNPSNVS